MNLKFFQKRPNRLKRKRPDPPATKQPRFMPSRQVETQTQSSSRSMETETQMQSSIRSMETETQHPDRPKTKQLETETETQQSDRRVERSDGSRPLDMYRPEIPLDTYPPRRFPRDIRDEATYRLEEDYLYRRGDEYRRADEYRRGDDYRRDRYRPDDYKREEDYLRDLYRREEFYRRDVLDYRDGPYYRQHDRDLPPRQLSDELRASRRASEWRAQDSRDRDLSPKQQEEEQRDYDRFLKKMFKQSVKPERSNSPSLHYRSYRPPSR